MSSTEAAIESVLNRLPHGWEAGSSLPDEFLHVWRERLGAVEMRDWGSTWLKFTADLGQIRLRGTDECYCLLISGTSGREAGPAQQFVSRTAAAGRLLFIFAASPSALAIAAKCSECVIVDSTHLIQ